MNNIAIVLLAPLALLSACAKMDADDFRDGVPTRDAAELKVPGSDTTTTTGALTATGDIATTKSALLGERAEFYTFTRTVTAGVNGGTIFILGLVKTITTFPPSSLKGDVAVWGPYTDPLSPNTWRLTVTRVEMDKFQYVLEARGKTEPDSALLTILSGTHTRGVDGKGIAREGFGAGTFTLNWDNAQKLPEHDTNIGVAAFTYARPNLTDPTTIDVNFTGIKDDKTGEIHDAIYQYAATPGAGGDFQYEAMEDFTPDPGNTGTMKEKVTVHSRWKEDGAGRSDWKLAGGDLGAVEVTTNECWDSNFASVWKAVSIPLQPTWGAESSCAFSPADYSTL
ncbi:MAG TPA: hypothetical protein VGL59_26235 [Polyangia bacterium]